MENIELEFSSLYVRIKSLEEKVQGDEALQQQLEPFLQVNSTAASYVTSRETRAPEGSLDLGQCDAADSGPHHPR